MLLIVGLGNPGDEYQQTRHNIGFLLADYLADSYGFSAWKLEKKWHGFIARGSINGEKILLLKPQTFMNSSGRSVQLVASYYQILADRIVVLADDLDQSFSLMKWKNGGGSGGHNGLKSVNESLGTSNFPRLKIGIDNALKSQMKPSDFVLKKFTKEELLKLETVFIQAQSVLLENIRNISV